MADRPNDCGVCSITFSEFEAKRDLPDWGIKKGDRFWFSDQLRGGDPENQLRVIGYPYYVKPGDRPLADQGIFTRLGTRVLLFRDCVDPDIPEMNGNGNGQ